MDTYVLSTSEMPPLVLQEMWYWGGGAGGVLPGPQRQTCHLGAPYSALVIMERQ